VDEIPMYQLYARLKSLKNVFRVNNQLCFGDLKKRVMKARDNLDLVHKEVFNSLGSADCLLKERECLHTYVLITKTEESFLKQKARNQWL
jgi:hypothetical protein